MLEVGCPGVFSKPHNFRSHGPISFFIIFLICYVKSSTLSNERNKSGDQEKIGPKGRKQGQNRALWRAMGVPLIFIRQSRRFYITYQRIKEIGSYAYFTIFRTPQLEDRPKRPDYIKQQPSARTAQFARLWAQKFLQMAEMQLTPRLLPYYAVEFKICTGIDPVLQFVRNSKFFI